MNPHQLDRVESALPEGDFAATFLHGLKRRPKATACKLLYDARGSVLFEEICDLPEYYPRRTEATILSRCAGEVAHLAGQGAALIELGSGSSMKTRILLESLGDPAAYIPVDISGEQLRDAARELHQSYPFLPVFPVHADYTQPFQLPEIPDRNGPEKLLFFPGSTIGNFEPAKAQQFLARLRVIAGPSGILLIGVDLQKDPDLLHAAYNDSQGVTAQFNKNLLDRANRELNADFDLSRFRHQAIYNKQYGRIEMYLVSLANQTVRLGGESISFARGETITTEHSYKYTINEFQRLAQRAGYEPVRAWTDPENLFSVHLLRFETTPDEAR